MEGTNRVELLYEAICCYQPHGLYFYHEDMEQCFLLESVISQDHLIFKDSDMISSVYNPRLKPVLYDAEFLHEYIVNHGELINPMDEILGANDPEKFSILTHSSDMTGGYVMIVMEGEKDAHWKYTHWTTFRDYRNLVKWKMNIFSLEQDQWVNAEDLDTNPYKAKL